MGCSRVVFIKGRDPGTGSREVPWPGQGESWVLFLEDVFVPQRATAQCSLC